ncbi:hypothetical protein RHCRD62_40370 [Rhodococcus sp. RD6.2]|nr:hypothetical protein RHCRD62_40370 [Rhodococcus sp. RD6.2]
MKQVDDLGPVRQPAVTATQTVDPRRAAGDHTVGSGDAVHAGRSEKRTTAGRASPR